MRTHSPTEAALLRAGRLVFHMRAEVTDPAGAWIDYTNAFGINWVKEVRWSASIDRPVMSGTVTLLRETLDGTISLAPSITGSPANSGGPGIEKGRLLRLSVACVPPGTTPGVPDWREQLVGVIDGLEYGGKSPLMVVEFRDIGARFLDTNITDERTYGSTAGVDAAVVMDAITDDNWSVSAYGAWPAVYVPDPVGSAFAVSPAYPQRMESVSEAHNNLAMQFGQAVRYKYDASDLFRYTLYDPQRDRTDVDATFAAGEYIDLPRLNSSRDDVRNQVRIRFISDVGTVETYYAEDAASIAAFGPKFMFLGLDVATQVRNFAQAAKLADSALWDLSEPPNEHVTDMFCFWPSELGDRYTFQANGRQYDVDQTLAVLGFDHVYTAPGKARTSLTTRGKIAGMGRLWRERGNVGPIPIDKERPEITARITPGTATIGSSVNVYLTPRTTYPELLGVRVKFRSDVDQAAFYLCVGPADATPRFVASGTELGPTDWFYWTDGTSAIYAQLLANRPLLDLETSTIWVQSYGFFSQLNSDWLTVVLDQRPRPELASASISATNPINLGGLGYYIRLTVTFTGGRGIGSVSDIRVMDMDGDPADAILDAVDIVPGQTITRVYEVTASASQVLDKTWGAILTPNTHPLATAGTGLPGFPITVTTDSDAYQNASQLDMVQAQTDIIANNTYIASVEAQLGNYIPLAQKGAASGVATLDGSSKVPVAQLPAIAITDVFVVASQAAMLALTAERGDVAVRTDNGNRYILAADDPTVLANWVLLTAAATTPTMPPTVQLPFGNLATIAAAGDSARGAPAGPFRVVGWHVDAVDATGAKVAISAQFTIKLLPFAGGAPVTMVSGASAPKLVTQSANSGSNAGWSVTDGVAGDAIMATLSSITPGTATSLLLTLTLQPL